MKQSNILLLVILAAAGLFPQAADASNAGDFSGGVAIGTSYSGVDAAPTNGLIVQGAVSVGTSSPTTGTSLDLGSNTNAILLPSGTTAQRPSGVNGMLRYNSTTTAVEAYANSGWTPLGGANSSGSSGYTTLPGGILMQWGSYTGDGTYSFPASFPNNCFVVVASQASTTDNQSVQSATCDGTSSFKVLQGNQNGEPASYIAIGN